MPTVTKMESSLPVAYAHNGGSAQNSNTAGGTQNINSGAGNQNTGSGQQFIGTNNIVNNYNHASSFLRVSEELKAISDEAERMTNRKGKHEMHFLVPYSRNPAFTPRSTAAQEINRLLAGRLVDEQTRIAIHGLGGAGKTQIALNFAYTNKRVKDVYWVNGGSIESFTAHYSEIAQLTQFAIKTQGMKPKDVCVAVKKWLESEDSKDWLLFVDNADQLTNTYVESIQLYLPKYKGTIIFTSRDSNIGGKLVHPGFCIELEAAMTEDEAVKTFNSVALRSYFNSADIENIVRRLDYLPLAIVQAAAYIRQNRVTIAEYLDRLEKSEAKLLAIPLQEVDQEDRTVMTTWKVSYDYIYSQMPLATNLLDIMSYLDFQGIQKTLLYSEELATVMAIDDVDFDIINFDAAMGLLQSFALVSSSSASSFSSYRMHRLVSLWTRQNTIMNKSKAVRTTLQIVSTVFGKYTEGDLLQYEVLVPHVEAILLHTKIADELQDDRISLLSNTATYYIDAGQWSKSEKYFHDCLSFHEKRLGAEHPSTLKTVHSMANVYDKQDRYEEALEWYRRALAGKEKALGKEHPSTLETVHNIALVYNRQGRYEEALEWYGRALAGKEKVLGKEHLSTLDTVHNMANVYDDQGRYEEALDWYRRALAGYEQTLGAEHPSTLDTVNNIAVVYINQGRYEEALEWYRRALVGKEKVLGKEHPSTLDVVHNVANVYDDQGRYEEALKWYGRALVGCEKALGKDHSSTLDTVHNIAAVYSRQGRYEEALEWCGRALAGFEKALGEEHPSTLDTVHNITLVYSHQGRYEKALEWYGRALASKEKVLGKEHPSTLDTVNNIAFVYNRQGRYEEALEWYRRALAGYEQTLSKEHPSTLNTVNNIALVYNDQGRYEQALGKEHPSTFETDNQIAVVYRNQSGSRGLRGRWLAMRRKWSST